MIVYLATFLISASVAAALTPASRLLSVRLGALDIPDNRKVHRMPMPRLGGLAIVAAFLAPVIGLAIVGAPSTADLSQKYIQVIALVVGGVIIAALGILDDTRGLRARTKLCVHVSVAAVAWLSGFRFENIGIPFLGAAQLPEWLDFFLSVLWIAGVINAMNLIDGLDGLAAGVTFFVALTNLVLSLRSGNELGALFAAAIAGSVIGFLLFNWNPAIVFMGDTGSMFLGYILATTSIMTNQKVSTAVAMLVPIMALGVPVIDTLLSIVRRFLQKRSIFSPDKGHLHHRLLRAGLTKRKAVLVIYALSIVLAVSAIAMTAARDVETAAAMGVLAVVVVGIVRFFGFFNLSAAVRGALKRSPIAERLRPKLPHFTAHVVSEAASVEAVFNEMARIFRECGFAEVSWRTAGISPPDERRVKLIKPDDYEKAMRVGLYKVGSSVSIDKGSHIEVQFVYPKGIGQLNQEADAMLNMVVDAVGAAISRLRREGKWEECTPQPKVDNPEPRISNSEPGTPESTANAVRNSTEGEEIRNPIFDGVWERFIDLCKEKGFVGAGWRTIGVKPADVRNASFNERICSECGVIKRSVLITSLAFIEIYLFYQGSTGRRTPSEIRKKARDVSILTGKEIRELHRYLALT